MESLPAFVPQRLRATVRDAIAEREFLLGRFTLADIAVAAALQAVRPHARFPLGLGPAQRDAWARPALAARFEDVLAWRDRVVARDRVSGPAR